MSRTYILLGVIAAFLLLVTVPPLGILFIIGCVIVGAVMWAAEHRATSRPCPVCGEAVPNGVTECSSCGHDFKAAATR